MLSSPRWGQGGQSQGFGMAKPNDLDETKRLMGALVRMKPKPHEDMKVGKKAKKAKRKKKISPKV
jgi:hypothetical protein